MSFSDDESQKPPGSDPPQEEEFDLEEQRPLLVSATLEDIHKLLTDQREEIHDMKKQLKEQQDEMQKQQELHHYEMHKLETKIDVMQGTMAEEAYKVREEAGEQEDTYQRHRLRRSNTWPQYRPAILTLIAGARRRNDRQGEDGEEGLDEDEEYALEEDIFSLMMTNEVFEPKSLPQMPTCSPNGMVKRLIQVLCGIGGIGMLVYGIYGVSDVYGQLYTFRSLRKKRFNNESIVNEMIFIVLGSALIGWLMSSLNQDFVEGGTLEQYSRQWMVFKRCVQGIYGIGGIAMSAYALYELLAPDEAWSDTAGLIAFLVLGIALIVWVMSSLEPDFAQGGTLEQYSRKWIVFKRCILVLLGISMLGYSILDLFTNIVTPIGGIVLFVPGIAIIWWFVSGPWLLGMVTFGVFQLGLGSMIIYDQWINTRDQCKDNENTSAMEACLPFNIPIRVGVGVNFTRYAAVILVLATQNDVLSSIQTVLLLKNTNGIPWDKVIGEGGEEDEDNRTWSLWTVRILIPNMLKLIQALVILFASFIIIIQSETIVELLKDFTAVLVISEADNLIFYVVSLGYFGGYFMDKAKKVKDAHWKIDSDATIDQPDSGTHSAETDTFCGNVKRIFNLYVCIFGILCITMIGGVTYIVWGQYSGKWVEVKYPHCDAYIPSWIGDGICHIYYSHNTEACGYDGGDCIVFNAKYPDCHADSPSSLGDGWCDDVSPYNTAECGFDGGDCKRNPVTNHTECLVHDPDKIGDGYCQGSVYNTAACGFDGGDCDLYNGLTDCNVDYPHYIGDGRCNDWPPYNTAECGWDGGDCEKNPVDEYSDCFVHEPDNIGDGRCDDHDGPYNTEVCRFDGGDCDLYNGLTDCNVDSPDYIGDGDCNDYPPYNTEECGFDGGDCNN